MPLYARQEGGSDFEPIKAGLHQAVCVRLIDLGLQSGYKDKLARKVQLTWELPEVRIDIPVKNGSDGETRNVPRLCNCRYTLSLNTRAHLYQMLVSWRGKPFTAEQLEGFDLSTVLRANGQVNIVNEPSKADASRVYSNVNSVMPLSAGQQKAAPETDIIYFSFDDWSPGDTIELPDGLSDNLRKTIMESPTFREIENPSAAVSGYVEPSGGVTTIDDDDVPF